MKKNILFLIICLCSISIYAQTFTETFENQNINLNSFISGGKTFNLSSNNFLVNSDSGFGYNMSNNFIESSEMRSLISSSGKFKLNSLWIYLSNYVNGVPNATLNNQPGSVTFIGKTNGITQFVLTKNTNGLNSGFSLPGNGFIKVDFATEGGGDYTNIIIDQLEIELSNNYNYFAIDNFTFTDVVPPIITTHPSNKTINYGKDTSFSVIANNVTSYQWQVKTSPGANFENISNNSIYSGVTTPMLSITAATLAMNGYQYRCVVNGSESIYTNNATLTVNVSVNQAPTIIATGINPTYTAGAVEVPLFSGTSINTIEPEQKIVNLKIQVSGIQDIGAEELYIDGSKVLLLDDTVVKTTINAMDVVVSVEGGIATVLLSKNEGISSSILSNIVNGISYRNTSSNLNNSNREVALISIKDNGGTANGGVAITNTYILSKVNVVGGNYKPVIASVTALSSNGSYKIGNVISIAVTFDKVVFVTGIPQLTLETGSTDRIANYKSGSGTQTLLFDYIVEEGDITSDLDYISSSSLSLNGGTIKALDNLDAVLILPNPGAPGSLGANKNISIDGVRPTASIVVSDPSLAIGNTAIVTITFSEAIMGFTPSNLTFENGLVTSLSRSDGGVTWTATFIPMNDITSLNNVIILKKYEIQDISGNTGTGTSSSNNFTIDTKRPIVTSISVPANKTYKQGDVLAFRINYSENINITGTPALQLTIGTKSVWANYVSGSGTNSLNFEYIVQKGDFDLNGITVDLLSLNGGTIKDISGNDADLILNNIDLTAGILVDTKIADLAIILSSQNISNTLDDVVMFTVTAVNNGDDNVDNAIVNVYLPNGFIFVSATPSVGTYDGTGVWKIGNLNNGGTQTLMINARVNTIGTQTLTGTISSSVEDNILSNNSSTVSIQVTKKSQIIEFNPLGSIKYGEEKFLTGTASSNLEVTYVSSDNNIAEVKKDVLNNWVIVAKNVGTVLITAKQAGDETYFNAADIIQSLTITKAQLTITADKKSKNFGTNDPILTYQITAGKLVGLDVLTGTLQRIIGENVGVFAINQGTLAAGANYNVTFIGANFEIIKSLITGISFTDKTFVYDGTTKSLAITGDLPMGVTVSYTNNGNIEAGIYNVTADIDGGNNYISQTLNAKLIIEKSLITGISFTDKTFVYDGTTKSLAITGTLPAGVTVNYTNNGKTNAGSYVVTAVIGGANFGDVILHANLTIDRAPQQINWTQELVIGCNGEKTIQLTAFSTSGLAVNYVTSNDHVATISDNILTILNGGYALITVEQPGDRNYLPAISVSKNLTSKLIGMIKSKWNDVVIFDNSNNNYVSFQWYKDGKVIYGATGQYYKSALLLSGNYHVVVKDKNGNELETCSLHIDQNVNIGGIKVTPNPVRKGSTFTVFSNYSKDELKGSEIFIRDMLGKLYQQINNVQPETKVQVPPIGGVYIIYLVLSNGHKDTIKLLVH